MSKKLINVTVFTVDGSAKAKTLDPAQSVLKQLQEFVGGWIEIVGPRMAPFLKQGDCLVVNETGKLINLEPNPTFSGLVGDVVLMRYNDIP
jgi:hypothetical protein